MFSGNQIRQTYILSSLDTWATILVPQTQRWWLFSLFKCCCNQSCQDSKELWLGFLLSRAWGCIQELAARATEWAPRPTSLFIWGANQVDLCIRISGQVELLAHYCRWVQLLARLPVLAGPGATLTPLSGQGANQEL